MRQTRINPITILYTNLAFSVICISEGGTIFAAINFIIAAVFLAMFREWKRLLKCSFLFTASYVVFRMLVWRGATGWQLPLSYAANLIFRMTPILMLVTLLTSNIKASQLMSALESIYLPKKLVLLFTVAFRFFPTFRNDFRMMKNSMRIRNIEVRFYQPLRAMEYYLVPVLYRCQLLAEELTSAGLIKGIGIAKRRTSVYNRAFGFGNAVFCLLLTSWLVLVLFREVIF